MLTAEGCRRRRARLRERLPDLEWVVLGEQRHVTYFTGWHPGPFVYSTQNAPAALILGADGSSSLIADNVLAGTAASAHVDSIVAPVWYSGVRSALQRQDLFARRLAEEIQARRPGRIGVDGAVPAAALEGVPAHAVGETIRSLMRQKDPDELALIRASIAAGEAGFKAAFEGIRPGMTELQAYLVVQSACIEAAGKPVIVYGDFASGERLEKGGGGPTERVIQAGELFLLDYSVVVSGYRGDFTNTWVTDGSQPPPETQRMAGLCLEAMEAGEALLQAGTACRDIDSAVRAVFRREGLADRFTHHTGHGLGLGHPDPPYLVPESEDILLEGDVITLEPGLYVPGVAGMRFERNYLITDSGFELLTRHRLGLNPIREA